MSNLVPPHGGSTLKPLMLSGEPLAAAMDRARTLPTLKISAREKGDLIMLGIGGFTPLDGFISRADCPTGVRATDRAECRRSPEYEFLGK